MSKSKIITFTISLLGTAYLLIMRMVPYPNECYMGGGNFCWLLSETVYNLSIFFPFILLFSLITFKMQESVFAAWWKFARVAVPLVFFVLFLVSLELHHTHATLFNLDHEKDLAIYFVTYSVFVLGSLVQIFRGLKSSKSYPSST